MKKELKNLRPNVDELTSKDLKKIYGGGPKGQPGAAGGDKGDPGYASNNGEACCCGCKC